MPNRNMGFRLECKTAKAGKKGEILIYSSISNFKFFGDEVTSRDFSEELKNLGDVDEITVRINSPGGSVADAVAIRTALMKHPATKTIDIEGSCCSAATIIACLPGAKVRMARGSDYMIHRCSWAVRGRAADMLAAYNSMINTDNDIATIYAERTGMQKEEALELMDKTTWYNVDTAMAAGFVDEAIEAAEAEEEIAACAMDADIYETMKACYGEVPAHPVIPRANKEVSNENKAVAAGSSSENMGDTPENEGGNHMELREATAEAIQQENPEAAQAIADTATQNALAAERERISRINRLVGRSQRRAEMARQAIEEGTSVEAFMQAIFAEEEAAGDAYLENRRQETRGAENIGAGDSGDLDGKSAREAEDKMAKEIAELAAGMTVNVMEMA